MSIIPSGLTHELQFYLSGPMPCPYLPGRIERKLFTRLDKGSVVANAGINAALCRAGFRRSHDIAYRPACAHCNACVPVRLAVAEFAPSATLRRTVRRNADLIWGRAATASSDELFALFRAYQAARHHDSEMARMERPDFDEMLNGDHADSQLYQLRDDSGRLLAAMIVDPTGDGLSAVYSFFDAATPRRSLGTQLILSLIEEARAQRLAYIYLGYWIAGSRKMAYKDRFQPQQQLGPRGWHDVTL